MATLKDHYIPFIFLGKHPRNGKKTDGWYVAFSPDKRPSFAKRFNNAINLVASHLKQTEGKQRIRLSTYTKANFIKRYNSGKTR